MRMFETTTEEMAGGMEDNQIMIVDTNIVFTNARKYSRRLM